MKVNMVKPHRNPPRQQLYAENKISSIVLQGAFQVHKALGAGLLPTAYKQCLGYQLRRFGLQVDIQKEMPIVYGDLKVEMGYSIDLMIESRVLIQIKCSGFTDLDRARMNTYLKLSGCKMGFLINFNVSSLKQGIRRVILSHPVGIAVPA